MTREEAQKRINEIPEFIPAPCPQCGARTIKEAEQKCRPTQSQCGDYYCATPDRAPKTRGLIHQFNPEFAELDGYLWHWFAYDDGLTTKPPVWREDLAE